MVGDSNRETWQCRRSFLDITAFEAVNLTICPNLISDHYFCFCRSVFQKISKLQFPNLFPGHKILPRATKHIRIVRENEQMKVKKFNASDTRTSNVPLENPERVRIGDCKMCLWVTMKSFIHKKCDATLNNTKSKRIVDYVL